MEYSNEEITAFVKQCCEEADGVMVTTEKEMMEDEQRRMLVVLAQRYSECIVGEATYRKETKIRPPGELEVLGWMSFDDLAFIAMVCHQDFNNWIREAEEKKEKKKKNKKEQDTYLCSDRGQEEFEKTKERIAALLVGIDNRKTFHDEWWKLYNEASPDKKRDRKREGGEGKVGTAKRRFLNIEWNIGGEKAAGGGKEFGVL